MKEFIVEFDVHDCAYGLRVMAKSPGSAKFRAFDEWKRICDDKGFSEPTCGEFLRYCKVREA